MRTVSAAPNDIGALLDTARAGAYQRWLVFLTATTVVFDGIDNQLLGVVIPTVMKEWQVPRSAFAPVVSLGYAGMMVGGALAGMAGDRFGRKQALLGSVAVFGADDAGHRGGSRHDDAGGAALSRRHRARWRAAQCGHARGRVRGAGEAADGRDRDHRVRTARRDAGRHPRQSVSRWRASAGAPLRSCAAVAAPLIAASGADAPRAAGIAAGYLERVRTIANGVERAPISSLFAAEFRRDTIALWFSFCSCLLAVYLGFSWLPTVLAGAGFDPGVASSGITAFNLGGVVGALASGAVMSRIGSRAAMLTMTVGAIAGALTLSMMTISIEAPLAPIMIMLTITGGLINAIQTTMYALATNVYPSAVRATGVGAATAVGRTGAIISGYAGPWALAFRGSASYFALIAGAMVVCFLALASVRRHVRQVRGPRVESRTEARMTRAKRAFVVSASIAACSWSARSARRFRSARRPTARR